MAQHQYDALALAELGYEAHLVRLSEGTKRPRDKSWTTGGTPDLSTFNSSVGIRCEPHNGEQGVQALDVDITAPDIAAKVMTVVESVLGEEFPYRIGQAPKFLIPFRLDSGRVTTLPKRVVKFEGHAVEVLGRGQQFVAAGIHPTTREPFRWERPLVDKADLISLTEDQLHQLIDAIIASVPLPVLNDNCRAESKGVTGGGTEADIAELDLCENRLDNEQWFRLVVSFRDSFKGGALEAKAKAALINFTSRWTDPSPGSGRPSPEGVREADVRRVHELWADSPADKQCQIPWHVMNRLPTGEPVDLFQSAPAPDLPIDCIPEPFQSYVKSTAERIGTPVMAAFVGAMAAAQAVLDSRITIQPKPQDPSWTERTCIWMALIGDPSVKKTPAIDVSMRAAEKIERQAMGAMADRIRKNKAERAAYGKQMKIYEEKLANSEEADLPSVPDAIELPRFIVRDATIEKIGEILSNAPRGLTWNAGELVQWFSHVEGKYDAANRGDWLRAYDGGPHRFERIKRGDVQVENWTVRVVGTIQPQALRKALGASTHDGLLQRFTPFLLAADDVGEGLDIAPDEVAERSFNSTLSRIAEMSHTVMHGDCVVTVSDPVQVPEDIREAIKACLRRMRMTVSAGGEHYASHVGKLDGSFHRWLLLYHCIEGRGGNVSWETAERVIRLHENFLIHHIVALYESVLNDSDRIDTARSVASFILTNAMDQFTVGSFTSKVTKWRDLASRDRQEVLSLLHDFNWIEPINDRQWSVKPRVRPVFEERRAVEEARKRQSQEAIHWLSEKRRKM